MIADWSVTQREAAPMMMVNHGPPTVAGNRMFARFGHTPFVKTVIARDEARHNFSIAHIGLLTRTVKHRVPPDRLATLNVRDGRVSDHRTRVELSAQCDVKQLNRSHSISHTT